MLTRPLCYALLDALVDQADPYLVVFGEGHLGILLLEIVAAHPRVKCRRGEPRYVEEIVAALYCVKCRRVEPPYVEEILAANSSVECQRGALRCV